MTDKEYTHASILVVDIFIKPNVLYDNMLLLSQTLFLVKFGVVGTLNDTPMA